MSVSNSTASVDASVADAVRIAREVYGLEVSATRLAGEFDLNMLLDDGTRRYLLKIAQADADVEELRFQNAVMRHQAQAESLMPLLQDIADPARREIARRHFMHHFDAIKPRSSRDCRSCRRA